MASPIRAVRLRTEYFADPLGIDETEPRFSWWVEDPRPGARQTARRIRCASDPALLREDRPDLWDTGKIADNRQAHVAYAGAPLTSRQQVWWDVQLWDADGHAGDPGDPATFEMGLLAPGDWQAHWVATPLIGTGRHRAPVPRLRRTFTVATPVDRARLYITAAGLYVATVNGHRVGNDWFRPGWTDYAKRLQYQTYDVTDLLVAGDNTVEVLLGDGWYCGRIAHYDRALVYGERPALLAQLEIGGAMAVVTDAAWEWAPSPILGADLIDGEDYDARREGCASWQPVEVVAMADLGPLVASASPPVRCVAELRPVAAPRRVSPGWGQAAWIYDLGQNMTGVARVRVQGPAGATLRIRYGEMLQANGQLYTENLRSARATDCYTLRGDPNGEVWTPIFTFHGFRYVELSIHERWLGGQPPFATPAPDAVTGLVLMSATPETGTFTCDHDLLNQLHRNICWGQHGNFIEVPTDCPQRDERLGWTGDAQVFAPTAAFIADTAGFFTKWLGDIADAQLDGGEVPWVCPALHQTGDGGPGWSDAAVVVPWAMYEAYADERLLARHYPCLKRYVDYLHRSSRDGLRCGPWFTEHRGFGDWLALDVEGHSATSKTLIGTAYYAATAGIAAEIAGILGHAADAEVFAARRAAAVAAFNREFVAPAGTLTEPTQTAHLMALAWDLLPEDLRPVAFARLLELFAAKDWHLCTGFLGTPLICPVLTRFGRPDLACRVLFQTTYPGWLFPVVNGATTMWERWNSWTPDAGFGDVGMNSFNHYAYGAVGKWIYSTLGGIAPGAPGYRHVVIAPRPQPPLGRAETALDSLHGRVESVWHVEHDTFHLRVRIPANTTATVRLPTGASHDVAAGEHAWAVPWPPR